VRLVNFVNSVLNFSVSHRIATWKGSSGFNYFLMQNGRADNSKQPDVSDAATTGMSLSRFFEPLFRLIAFFVNTA